MFQREILQLQVTILEKKYILKQIPFSLSFNMTVAHYSPATTMCLFVASVWPILWIDFLFVYWFKIPSSVLIVFNLLYILLMCMINNAKFQNVLLKGNVMISVASDMIKNLLLNCFCETLRMPLNTVKCCYNVVQCITILRMALW